MVKKIKSTILAGLMALALVMPLGAPALVGGVASASNIKGSVCAGATAASGETCKQDATLSNSSGGIQTLAGNIVNIFSIVIGAVAIIMLLYGGFRYITSGGDSGRVGNAKNTLLYAIIGLVIVALAQLIVNFVLGAASNAGSNIVQ